jgi:hypothetical protein
VGGNVVGGTATLNHCLGQYLRDETPFCCFVGRCRVLYSHVSASGGDPGTPRRARLLAGEHLGRIRRRSTSGRRCLELDVASSADGVPFISRNPRLYADLTRARSYAGLWQ